jgi:hypothetical protein
MDDTAKREVGYPALQFQRSSVRDPALKSILLRGGLAAHPDVQVPVPTLDFDQIATRKEAWTQDSRDIALIWHFRDRRLGKRGRPSLMAREPTNRTGFVLLGNRGATVKLGVPPSVPGPLKSGERHIAPEKRFDFSGAL